jgi:hypothetical protein
MGLKFLNEDSILLNEASPIVGFLEKYMVKGLIDDSEKILLRKFINPAVHGALNETEKLELRRFLNSTNGAIFISDLRQQIQKETDDALKFRMDGWLKNNLEKFAKEPFTPKPVPKPKPKPKPSPVNVLPRDIEQMAVNHGIDTKGITDAIIVDSAKENMSRAEKLRLEMAEEINKIKLDNAKEDLRVKKEFNDLNLLAKEQKIKLDSLDKEIKELEIKGKTNKLSFTEQQNLIQLKLDKQKLWNERIETGRKMKGIFAYAAIIGVAFYAIYRLCGYFPSLCSKVKEEEIKQKEKIDWQ